MTEIMFAYGYVGWSVSFTVCMATYAYWTWADGLNGTLEISGRLGLNAISSPRWALWKVMDSFFLRLRLY